MDTCFHFSWIYTRSGIARSYGNSVNSNPVCKLNHWRSWPTAPFYIPTTSVWGQSLPILTNTCYCLFQLQPCQWVWSGISWLGFACPWWLMTLSIFSWTGWPCVPLAWGNVYPSPWCILIGSFLYWTVNLETYFSLPFSSFSSHWTRWLLKYSPWAQDVRVWWRIWHRRGSSCWECRSGDFTGDTAFEVSRKE